MSRSTLTDAYRALGLQDPVTFEAARLASLGDDPVRGVGTSTRMHVEAALDLCQDLKVIVGVPIKALANQVRAQILGFSAMLGASPSAWKNLTVTDNSHVRLSLTDIREPGPSRFVDHLRDILDGKDQRVFGPLGSARFVRPGLDGTYEVFDRHTTLLGTITYRGLWHLRERHFCEVPRRDL